MTKQANKIFKELFKQLKSKKYSKKLLWYVKKRIKDYNNVEKTQEKYIQKLLELSKQPLTEPEFLSITDESYCELFSERTHEQVWNFLLEYSKNPKKTPPEEIEIL